MRWLTFAYSSRSENAVCPWRWHDALSVVLRLVVPTIELWTEFLVLTKWNNLVLWDIQSASSRQWKDITVCVCQQWVRNF